MTSMHEIVERALSLSKADACIVIGHQSSAVNIRWANNTTTTNGDLDDHSLSIVSIIGKRVGSVSRSYFPAESLEDIVRASEAACEDKPDAEDFMPLIAGDGEPADWGAPAERTSVSVFDEFTPQLADMFRRAGAANLKTFGYAEHSIGTTWLATSAGVRRRFAQPDGKIDFTAKTEDFKRSSWAGHATSTFRDVNVAEMYRAIGQRLEWSEERIDMPAGRYEVLLTPSCVADLAIMMYWFMSSRDADEGRSVFSKAGDGNRVGDRVSAPGLTVYSDPSEPGIECTPFVARAASTTDGSVFDNGMRAGRMDWISDGVLTNLVRSRAWAARTGADPVPFVDNIAFATEGPTLDDMIARTERALLVNCLWYIRSVDPQTLLLTGLTRDGVFLVEGGEVKGAVNNFRWNMSPLQAFSNATEIGTSARAVAREFDEWGRSKAPPMRVAEFNMSSVSDAT